MTWDQLYKACNSCKRCRLCESRRNVVIGRGNINSDVMFVGEGPGHQEDEQGLPFVGAAGKLLDLALESCGFTPNDYYIANIVKCRPPENRNPLPDETEACMPFLRAQFALLKPRIIVCLGSVALKAMIDKNMSITNTRGKWTERKGVLFTATFHPAAVLRDETKKLDMWSDIRSVYIKLKEIGEK